jgi:hypothetical protein
MFILKYCYMHAVGQQSTVETLFITVAKQRNNGSDQRFLCALFRGNNSQCNSGCFPCGLFTGYIAGQLRGQLVSE